MRGLLTESREFMTDRIQNLQRSEKDKLKWIDFRPFLENWAQSQNTEEYQIKFLTEKDLTWQFNGYSVLGIESELRSVLNNLLENAVKHGLAPVSHQGQISVQVSQKQADLVAVIEDNGVGMTQEEQRKVLASSEDNHGIGLKNVSQRLKRFYGPDYGLKVEGEPGEGTLVQVKLPAVRRRESSD
jgi:signal transduction histidine kinase